MSDFDNRPVLGTRQIEQKIRRIAYEILEDHHEAEELFLVGINNNGHRFATLLHSTPSPE